MFERLKDFLSLSFIYLTPSTSMDIVKSVGGYIWDWDKLPSQLNWLMNNIEPTGCRTDLEIPPLFTTYEMHKPEPPHPEVDVGDRLAAIEIVHFERPNGFVQEYSSFYLRVRVTNGDRPLHYKWYHNDFFVGNEEVYKVDSATLTSSGEYHVIISDVYQQIKSYPVMVGVHSVRPFCSLTPLEKWISLMLSIIPEDLQLLPFTFTDSHAFSMDNISALFPLYYPSFLEKKSLILISTEAPPTQVTIFMVNCDDLDRLKNIIRLLTLLHLGSSHEICTPNVLQYVCTSLGISYHNHSDFTQLKSELYLKQGVQVAPPPNVSLSWPVLATSGVLMLGIYMKYGRNKTRQVSVLTRILSHLYYITPIIAVYLSHLFLKRKVTQFLGLPYNYSTRQARNRYQKVFHFYVNPNSVAQNQQRTMEIFSAFVKKVFESLEH